MMKLRACPRCGGDLVEDARLESLLDQRNADQFTCLQCGYSVDAPVHPAGEQEPTRQGPTAGAGDRHPRYELLRGRAQQRPDRESHPSAGQLEAVAFGWMAEDPEKRIQTHAVGCPACRPRLAAEEAVRNQLALLRADELEVDAASAWAGEP